MAAIAHLHPDGREHGLHEHLKKVGELAGTFAAKLGAAPLGITAGRLHDLGKYAADFQSYIRSSQRPTEERSEAHLEADANQTTPRRGQVNHSAAGALYARENHGTIGHILAFIIAGHHAGLANRTDLNNTLARWQHRLKDALELGVPPEVLVSEKLALPFSTASSGRAESEFLSRRIELFTRMLFSALCDADFLDTEAFFDHGRALERQAARDRSLATLKDHLTQFVDEIEATASRTDVNAVRRELRAAVTACCKEPQGIFTLTVPTGGGKTLLGMEFALGHALHHGLERVIVAVPYTAILEQNAEVYRRALGTDDAVLEHHSSFDPRRETARSRLASQNWDVPIVVTTTVQLFESLFARRTSRCRKLHNLARSVIVLDEAQTMPPRLLEPTLEVLGELVQLYSTTLVLSTATQPAFGRESLKRFGFEKMRELVPSELRAFERLERVSVQWPARLETKPYAELVDELSAQSDVLFITHLRRDARNVTELVDQHLQDRSTIHLSALMCPDHRRRVLAEVRRRKKAGEPIRVIATQLVEAGVDLDFPIVYRAMAGLDALAQAAGRCNREGLRSRGELRVFVAETSPPLGVPRRGLAITRGMLASNPSLNLFAPEAYRSYFEQLYNTTDTDDNDIQPARTTLRFEDVAAAYRLIESDWSQPIVVRYGRASTLLEELRREGPSRRLYRELGQVSVNVPTRLVAQWIIGGHARTDDESGVTMLAEHVHAYDERFGLLLEKVSGAASIDALIVDE